MDVSLDMWLGEYMEAVQVQFGPRVWFIGLQGSFGRGEATAESDLDVVLILDAVSAADLWAYSAMLDRLPERERVCGFVSGKGELLAWEPADLFQFCHDTRPLLGHCHGAGCRALDPVAARCLSELQGWKSEELWL